MLLLPAVCHGKPTTDVVARAAQELPKPTKLAAHLVLILDAARGLFDYELRHSFDVLRAAKLAHLS